LPKNDPETGQNVDTGARDELVSRLVEAVGSVTTAHPTRVAVDGPPAAGKTTLAVELPTVLLRHCPPNRSRRRHRAQRRVPAAGLGSPTALIRYTGFDKCSTRLPCAANPLSVVAEVGESVEVVDGTWDELNGPFCSSRRRIKECRGRRGQPKRLHRGRRRDHRLDGRHELEERGMETVNGQSLELIERCHRMLTWSATPIEVRATKFVCHVFDQGAPCDELAASDHAHRLQVLVQLVLLPSKGCRHGSRWIRHQDWAELASPKA
jgi:hypothetical protein